MSTRIGIISEGPVDEVLLPPLLGRIAFDKAQFDWPLAADDMAEIFPIRKRGHGGVLEKVRALVQALHRQPIDYDLFVILLDQRTRRIWREIRKAIEGKPRFVMGIAIEEIEAWWLGDRTNTLAWTGFTPGPPSETRYAAKGYKAERDDRPKTTLDELTRWSDQIDRYYGRGNVELAEDFALRYWQEFARLDEIASQCPKGFGSFQKDMTNAFRAAKARKGKLF